MTRSTRRRTVLAWAAAGGPCALAGRAAAQGTLLTISTNNTPLDRKALSAVSQEAFRRLGIGLRLVSLPSERSLVAANLGEVDGEGLRVAGLEEQYPNLVRVPERYVGISFVAFARDPSIALPNGWQDLQRYRVAFIKGWKLFETQAGRARIVQRVDRPEQLFQMVEHGHVDLALYTLADGRALARQMGLNAIAPVSPPLQEVDMFLYLHRRHEAQAPRLAQVLREMKADGSYARILSAVLAE